MSLNFFLALASLTGTIIGAGIFGITYLMLKAGVLPCFFYFLVLVSAVTLLHLLFAEVVLRTKGEHRLVFYTSKYLNKKAEKIVIFSTVVGVIGCLLAYIILAGRFASLILPSLSPIHWSLILWFVLSFLVLWGIRTIASVELWMNLALLAVFLVIFAVSLPKIQASSFSLVNSQVFLPFGVVLFSLIGFSAVPEVASVLKIKRDLKKVIIIGTVFSALVAFIFGLVVNGVSGSSTSQDAFQGLSLFLGGYVISLGGLFGILAVSTSFLILANYLKNTLYLDLHFPLPLAFLLTCFSPAIIFLLGLRGFIGVIGAVGTLVGVVEGIIIVLLYKEARKRGDKKPAFNLKIPHFLLFGLIALLIIGALAQALPYLNFLR